MRRDSTISAIELINFKSFAYFKKSYITAVSRWDTVIYFKYKSKGKKDGFYKYLVDKDKFYRIDGKDCKVIEREVNIYE